MLLICSDYATQRIHKLTIYVMAWSTTAVFPNKASNVILIQRSNVGYLITFSIYGIKADSDGAIVAKEC